jgi:ribosomal protein S18 acetylase RimI-like enzyme
MREDDADAVRILDADAFLDWERQVKGNKAQRYLRTRSNILVCREHDPEGCFVAEEDGRIVGFMFSRTWGGVAWFGTFAVHSQHQGRGVGKGLIAASMEYLQQEPGRIIGLETMAESPYNLGLYLGLGFETRLPTLMLSKSLVGGTANESGLACWSSADATTRERWLGQLAEASGAVQRGLDYSKEILSTDRHGLGETLIMVRAGQAVGMSTVWTVSACENWGNDRSSIKALALHPHHTTGATLRALVTGSETLARSRGKEVLTVPVNSRHAWAVDQLLRLGYRVRGMAVHMVLKGTDDGSRIDRFVEFSRWAG